MEGPDLAKSFMLVLLYDALNWGGAKTCCSEQITGVIAGVRSVFDEDIHVRKMFMFVYCWLFKMRQC